MFKTRKRVTHLLMVIISEKNTAAAIVEVCGSRKWYIAVVCSYLCMPAPPV